MKWAAAVRGNLLIFQRHLFSVARMRGLENCSCCDLGLTPQALCLRLLRRLSFSVPVLAAADLSISL